MIPSIGVEVVESALSAGSRSEHLPSGPIVVLIEHRGLAPRSSGWNSVVIEVLQTLATVSRVETLEVHHTALLLSEVLHPGVSWHLVKHAHLSVLVWGRDHVLL